MLLKLFFLTLTAFTLYAQTDNFKDFDKNWICKTQQNQKWTVTKQTLTLLKTDAYGSHFNTCYSKDTFLNGEISVDFRANSGREDQGGGIMWRVQNDNNYYVVRFNPLEDNLRVYYVKNSHRVLLKSADKKLDTKEWHTIKLIQNQNRYTIFLDGEKLLEGSDNTFTKAGGVGVWSKADALTSFKNLKVQKR